MSSPPWLPRDRVARLRLPASDAAANITGEALNVSGGQQMH